MKHGSLYHFAPSVKDRYVPDRYLGRQIGKYRVIRLLGGGAFAWVYEAVDRDLEIPVALKILRPEFAGQTEAEARFRREAAIAARLRHPNIVTVRDVGQVDGASFVAMDLLPLSLARRLELLQRLPETEVVRIGLDVAAALAIAHAGGVVHRDIKPDNILIGTHGEAVVADFGLARALSSEPALSGSNHVMGTPHYFSPEQARGLELDGRSDLYALGITLYRAATGRVPFEGDDWYAVARMHVEVPAPSARDTVPELSAEFDALVGRLLRKDPAERFASALQLADALAALPTAPTSRLTPTTARPNASETLSTTPVGSTAPARRPARWIRPTFALAFAAASVLAIWQLPPVRTLLQPLLRTLVRTLVRAERGSDRTSSTARATDTLVEGARDSLLSSQRDRIARADSARRTASTAGATAPGPRASTTSAAARAQLILTAPDSAVLYVDGVREGRGSATIERSAAARLIVRAIIADAPTACPTAAQETIVQLRAGERRALTLPVRTCIGISFNIMPADARLRFVPTDGSPAIDARADTTVLLPVGKYLFKASAPKCFDYTDSLLVTRSADGAPIFRRIRMTCN